MLLTEVNVHNQGVFDFLYLPMDFVNKCNIGYAFINFIDPVYILPFFEEMNGKNWSVFNSVKIC